MPRKPGTKQCNAEQLELRLSKIREALASFRHSADISAQYTAEWGVVARTIQGYITKVREETGRVKLITMTPEQKAREQNLVIEGIKYEIERSIKDGNHHAAMRGYGLLGDVYGIFVDRLELSGPGGGPIDTGMAGLADHLRKLEADARAQLAKQTAAAPTPTP